MGSHPINLAARFLLELVALFAVGYWGRSKIDGWQGYFLAFGLPLLLAVLWGVFAVPDDPSRSGQAPVPVSGLVRLALELFVFGIAVFALMNLGFTTYGWVLAFVVLFHYVLSYDRIIWLLQR